MGSSRPTSIVAERAVRYLRDHVEPVQSKELAHELLSTKIADESMASRVLESAFGGDPRLAYGKGGWSRTQGARPSGPAAAENPQEDADRVLLLLEGDRPARGRPWELLHLAAIRLHGDMVVATCGGEPGPGPAGKRLRRVLQELLNDAVPVMHDPPGALAALERFLGEPLDRPLSLRRLAHQRKELPAQHDLEALMAALEMSWRDTGDSLELADTLDECLERLRRPDESLGDLRADLYRQSPPIDWTRYDFDRTFLRSLPRVAGTYRFYDDQGELLYAGKSSNLYRRVGSYFREGQNRPAKTQKLLDQLHRIEIEPVGSDLEAMLHEAELIRQQNPKANVQRKIHPSGRAGSRLDSILILEPATEPAVLRAFLIRDARLLARVAIGPRGGGLKRIERVLEDHFFSAPDGPSDAADGPDLDVEIVARWLAANRDRAVAFDPTDLRTAREVIGRLQWFLSHQSPFDPDGAPITSR